MNWQNCVNSKLRLFLLLSGLALLLSGCDRGLWRRVDRLLAAEDRLAAVERQAAEALRQAQEAKALAGGGGSTAPVCPPLPAGSRPGDAGGVALRVGSPISGTLQLYPVSDVEVYGTDNFAKFLAETRNPVTATIMLAVAGTPGAAQSYTLYAQQASAPPASASLSWQLYSLQQPTNTLSLSVPQAISTTRLFNPPPNSSLSSSVEALSDVGFPRALARYLILARQENDQPVYTLVVFEGDGSGAGNNRVCVWCRNCGAPCSSACRWYGCG